MFNTGSFARVAGISVRTLRHYDHVGLLAPAAVDAVTGYRFYRARQLPRLHRIIALKDLGLSLDELAPILEGGVSSEQLAAMLADKRSQLAERVATDQARLERVEQRLRHIELETDMSIDMVIKHIPQLRVAQVPWKGEGGLTFYTMGEFFVEAIRTLEESLDTAGVTAEGPHFLHYRERPDGSLDPSVAIAIGNRPFAYVDPVESSLLPAIDAVVTVYRGVGDHDLIGPVYGQMARFAEDNGYEIIGPGRDHVIGSEDGDMIL